jgi:L-threonylcarbamoyladenylate synthase
MGVAEAAQLLSKGELVAFPTETVYGLGADATNERAVARIFTVKERPSFNPLIVHVHDTAAARALARWTPLADALAAAFWPGPLTLILERADDCPISRLVSAGLPTVALRVPRHGIAQALISTTDRPIAAPSANRSGQLSPTTAAHVAASLGRAVPLILDAGPCQVGLESTVVDVTGAEPVILRPGGVAVESIEAALGRAIVTDSSSPATPKSPGMMEKHYAPRARLRLEADAARTGERLLGFGPAAPKDAPNLSVGGDLEEAAANLFAMLSALDEAGAEAVAVMPIPEHGLGRAINDRLRRAAR